LDLSAFEHDVALVIDLKVDVMPDKGVTIGMDCGYPCRSELQVRKNITKLSKGEWSSLPIPLNCFSQAGADLKKINGPFVMSTDGKLTVEIANVRLQKLAEGDKGCAQ
jgi:Galactose-binding domain-like